MTESDDGTSAREAVRTALRRLQAIRGSATLTDITTRIDLKNQISGLRHALDAALSLHEVPLELCHTLRAPAGAPRTVEFIAADRQIRVVLSPLGCVDPERELAVWHELLDLAGAGTPPGEQLRRMEPALLAVRLGDATLIVNTEHSRSTVRAALKLLPSGALVPAPVAWLLERARRRPERTLVTIVGAVTTAALAVTLVGYSALSSQPSSAGPPVIAAAPLAEDDDTPTGDLPVPTPALTTASPPSPADKPTPDGPDPSQPAKPDREKPESDNNEDDEGDRGRRERPEEEDSEAPPPARPGPSSADQPPPVASPDPSSSASRSSAPATTSPSGAPPAPEPSSPPPAPAACHLLDIDVNLPVLTVDVCV